MSHIPKLPSELTFNIDELIPKIDNSLLLGKRTNIGNIRFVDCLTGIIRKAKTIVENRINLPECQWGRAALCRHSEDGLAEVIFVIEATAWSVARNAGKLRNRIHNTLIHEFTHLLDRRPWSVRYRLLGRKFETAEWTDYYSERGEFDAYSSEIILSIIDKIKENSSIAEWQRFLKGTVDAEIAGRYFESATHLTAIRAWLRNDKINNTHLIRLFKLRLYAALYP